MGKGGALSVWLKEFTALIFTQAIQAFIYAIIISIILYGMGPRDQISADDNNAALGLMSTFALLSVFKVEEMAKKIFGISETKASHKNAMKSIAKTAIAAKLGKRVLNNAGKVFGGIKAINQSGQDRRKAKSRLEEDMKDNGFEMRDGKAVYVGRRTAATVAGAGAAAATAVGAVTASGSSGSFVDAPEAFADIQVGGDVTPSVTAPVGTSSSTRDVLSDASKRRMKNALRSYEDKLGEINKAKAEGIKSIASGLTESVGAIVGATTGGLLGGADGDLDEMLQGVLAGAGVGDIVGKTAVDGIDRAVQFAKRNANRKQGVSTKELKNAINAYKTAIEDMNVTYGINDISDI